MRAILVRVGIDQAFGGWNAPVDPNTGDFVFVPIPDGISKQYPSGLARSYTEMEAPLAAFAGRHGLGDLKLLVKLQDRKMHLDPDFEHLTYGDNGDRRGASIAKLAPGDRLVFYAGLRSVDHPRNLIYSLIGLYVIEEMIRAVDFPSELHYQNAHTRWSPISPNDIVVKGRVGESGRLNRSIPIGEWRDKAYRVRAEIEEAWGGLSVKDGFIQRSVVPPIFKDVAKFDLWFQAQAPVLLQRNN